LQNALDRQAVELFRAKQAIHKQAIHKQVIHKQAL